VKINVRNIFEGGHLQAVAFNPDGSKKWVFATSNIIVSSPAIGKDGTIYFTDPDYGTHPPDIPFTRRPELDYHGAYRVSPDGGVHLVSKDFGQPNGIALSPDGKRLYVDDTERGNIRVFDIAKDGGTADDFEAAVNKLTDDEVTLIEEIVRKAFERL